MKVSYPHKSLFREVKPAGTPLGGVALFLALARIDLHMTKNGMNYAGVVNLTNN
jgi:hypothetical protein